MFNFFNELKSKIGQISNKISPYRLMEIGNYALYFEGDNCLFHLSDEEIVFKVLGGVITVKGENLLLKEISNDTVIIVGKINEIIRM